MRYDEKSIVEDLRALDSKGMFSYACVFSRKMNCKTLPENERDAYAVLYAICSVDFRVREKNPFGELKLDESQTKIAIDIYPQILDPLLRSRVADAAWTVGDKSGKLRLDIVKDAVDAYSKIQINAQRWLIDGVNVAWERGLRLAKAIGIPVSSTFSTMKSAIKGAYDNAVAKKAGEDNLRIFIPSLLVSSEMLDVVGARRMASDFADLARKLITRGLRQEADQAFQNASYMFRSAGDDNMVRALLKEQIDNSIVAAKESEKTGDFRCAHIYNHALTLCLRIPKKDRATFAIDESIEESKSGLLRGYQMVALAMKEQRSPLVDISVLVKSAGDSMEGLDSKRALLRLATLKKVSCDEIEAGAFNSLQKDLSAILYPKGILRNDRLVAIVPPWSGKRGDDRHKYAMLEEFLFGIQYYYETLLKPAYDRMRVLYVFTRELFEQIVNRSHLISCDHRNHYVEGLLLGIEGRFAAATAMLCPEIENVVRTRLASLGCETSSLGRDGFFQEDGLSNLVAHIELEQAFGKDMAFELRFFFCDHRGVNMRNAVAHGLKSDEIFNSSFDFYVWWFSLRLALRPNTLV